MGENDTGYGVPVRICASAHVCVIWAEAIVAMHEFLHPSVELPPGITDRQLVDLMDACGAARKRLREKPRA